MSDRTFDPTTWLDAYRESFASVQKAQEQGFKAVERFARFQYAVAGDYLDAGIAQTQAALSAKTPAELLSKQTELNARLGDKLRTRAQEFATIASEVQGSVTSFATEAASKVASAKKAA
jgi:phasin family protein